MFKHINLSVLGGAFVVVVLLCVGIHFYIQWDNKRFVAEIGEPPQFTTLSEPAAEIPNDGTQADGQNARIEPVEFVSENAVVPESEPVEDPERMDEEVSTPQVDALETASEFDATPLLSAFGLPEEVTALFDEEAGEADFEGAQAHLIEEYGPSPEIEAIIDKLKQMSGGPVKLDDLTELFEAWIQVLPEEEQGTRRQLMDVLTQLHQAKALGADAEVGIEVHVIDADPLSD
uniref:Uncharacterized protein n=1 Tax=uncultured Poribacteria bacterium 64K2 TaxID=309182 RepID=Q24M52_9BACT|nr:hypothetical protein [uncultured Poribacteria bacterium 64K2]